MFEADWETALISVFTRRGVRNEMSYAFLYSSPGLTLSEQYYTTCLRKY